MRDFEILFDNAEASPIEDQAYRRYGGLGFPSAPADRPWIYSNFVQSLDGIVSFLGSYPSGSDIAQSEEDRWLMDLLRAHADAVLVGTNTLVEETITRGVERRGPVFRIMDDELRGLRRRLGRGREKNIFVTGTASIDLGSYRAFDGEHVDALVVTTKTGAEKLRGKTSHGHVPVIVAGDGPLVDLPEMAGILRRDFGVAYLLCEGGPTLYGYMSRAGLIDEKFLTISPIEVGQAIPPEQGLSSAGTSGPARLRPTSFTAPGFTKDTAPRWTWLSSRKVGDHEFNRYRRQR